MSAFPRFLVIKYSDMLEYLLSEQKEGMDAPDGEICTTYHLHSLSSTASSSEINMSEASSKTGFQTRYVSSKSTKQFLECNNLQSLLSHVQTFKSLLSYCQGHAPQPGLTTDFSETP